MWAYEGIRQVGRRAAELFRNLTGRTGQRRGACAIFDVGLFIVRVTTNSALPVVITPWLTVILFVLTVALNELERFIIPWKAS